MAKVTMQTALITALLGRGETEKETRASRYRMFTRTYNGARAEDGTLRPLSGTHHPHWFVTRGGALRVGDTFSASYPASFWSKRVLLAEGGYNVKSS